MNALCTLTATHWEGELPLLGHYVKADRGRTAYRIVEIRRSVDAARYVAKFICERHNLATLGPGDIVHQWQWAKR